MQHVCDTQTNRKWYSFRHLFFMTTGPASFSLFIWIHYSSILETVKTNRSVLIFPNWDTCTNAAVLESLKTNTAHFHEYVIALIEPFPARDVERKANSSLSIISLITALCTWQNRTRENRTRENGAGSYSVNLNYWLPQRGCGNR